MDDLTNQNQDQEEAAIAKALEESQSLQASQADDDELEDFELEPGQVKKLPRWAKDYVLREQDYRKKTMEVGETRKSLEQKEREYQDRVKKFGEETERQKKFIKDVGRFDRMEEELAEFNKVDWDKYEAENPDAARRAWRYRETLKVQRDELARNLSAKAMKDAEDSKAMQAKRRAEFEAAVKEKIKGWSPEKEAQYKTMLKEAYGVSEDEFAELSDVRLMQLVADAELVYRVRKASKEKTAAPQPKPVSQLGGAAPATQGPTDRDSVAAWMAKRNAAVMKAVKAGVRH